MKRACFENTNNDENYRCEFHTTYLIKLFSYETSMIEDHKQR
ncbi:MAG: hypothetical protein Q8904_13905 [Bacteroidota bacterium]|nr:hypothetical protein [Bacteroidota bacterium]